LIENEPKFDSCYYLDAGILKKILTDIFHE